jgi:hypothetical protein
MFRQFGSRLIVNGKRVKDDYWESKARKQGFTEEDVAGETRPGAGKQRLAEAQLKAQATEDESPEVPGVNAQSAVHWPVTPAPPGMNQQPRHNLNPPDYSSTRWAPPQDLSSQTYRVSTQSIVASEIMGQTPVRLLGEHGQLSFVHHEPAQVQTLTARNSQSEHVGKPVDPMEWKTQKTEEVEGKERYTRVKSELSVYFGTYYDNITDTPKPLSMSTTLQLQLQKMHSTNSEIQNI